MKMLEIDSINELNGGELAATIVAKLKENNLKLTFAESCTGGLASSGIVDVPGASEVFWGSMVSYDNIVKSNNLKVSKDVLDNFGAVSHECACAMAFGAKNVFDTDVAISITGIAGPGGGTPDKPVGTVFIGYADKFGVDSTRIFTEGDRSTIRRITCLKAYAFLLNKLEERGLIK